MSFLKIFSLLIVFTTGYAQNSNITTTAPTTTTTTPAITCLPPPQVIGASFVEYGNPPSANYTCELGRQLLGSAVISCTNGHWGAQPTCNRRYCPSPPRIPSSSYRLIDGSMAVGSAVKYTCYTGYYINATVDTIYCQPNWTWTNSGQFGCIRKDCGVPITIPNGNLTYNANNTRYLASAEYNCHPGYTLVSPMSHSINVVIPVFTIRCGGGGDWSRVPTCMPKSCGASPDVNDASKLVIGQNIYGDTVTFECKPGFRLTGNSTISCMASGEWGPGPFCAKITCDPPPTVASASMVSHDDYTYGGTVVYQCHKGYTSNLPLTIVCLPTGQWTPEPYCSIVSCRTPPQIHFGDRTWNSTNYGGQATYTCEENYKIIGTATISCLETGQWQDNPSCESISGPARYRKPSAPAEQSKESGLAQPNYRTGQIVASLSIACTVLGVACLTLIVIISIRVCPCASRNKSMGYSRYDDMTMSSA